MIAPRVHLNGSSANLLRINYRNARRAVDEAMDRLREAAPNGRDYYPIGDDALGTAMREHLARMEKLRAVSEELDALEGAVADQVRERERMRS